MGADGGTTSSVHSAHPSVRGGRVYFWLIFYNMSNANVEFGRPTQHESLIT